MPSDDQFRRDKWVAIAFLILIVAALTPWAVGRFRTAGEPAATGRPGTVSADPGRRPAAEGAGERIRTLGCIAWTYNPDQTKGGEMQKRAVTFRAGSAVAIQIVCTDLAPGVQLTVLWIHESGSYFAGTPVLAENINGLATVKGRMDKMKAGRWIGLVTFEERLLAEVLITIG